MQSVKMRTARNYLSKESLDEILVRTGMISAEQMQNVLQTACKDGKTVEQVLIEEKLVTSYDLITALSIQLRVPLIDLRRHKVSPEALRLVPEQLTRKYNVLPLDIIGGSLAIVMGDVMDVQAIDGIAAVTKMRIEPMMAFPDEIRKAIEQNYGVGHETEEEIAVLAPPPDEAPAPGGYGRELNELLKLMVDKGASDLHLKVPSPPVLRIDGELIPQKDLSPVTAKDVEAVFGRITTPEQKSIFFSEKELDFAYSVPGLARFRVNALQQRGTMGLAFRLVPFTIPSIDELGLPQVCKQLILKPRGLILMTGPAGSGKSTTMAAMVNHLNENSKRTVITIEDPIEFLHHDKRCIIVQRDLGDDTKSFSTALIHALRHDPNVIVIGEMRDLDTISTAITAAETGHLVLGTLHTIDTIQTVDRIIDMFPHGQQRQIRLLLSQVIEAILSQTLLPRIGGGQIVAFEIMIANSVVRNLIREERVLELPRNMELSPKEEGMQTLNQALADLVRSGIVSQEEAMMKSSDPRKLNELLQPGPYDLFVNQQ